MSMAAQTVKAGIKTRLETISKLRVYADAPDSINELPAAYIVQKAPAVPLTMGESIVAVDYDVIVLVSRAGDVDMGQQSLDPYTDATGTYSIRAAINADRTLDSSCACAWLLPPYDYGGLEYNGTTYMGCKFPIHVVGDG